MSVPELCICPSAGPLPGLTLDWGIFTDGFLEVTSILGLTPVLCCLLWARLGLKVCPAPGRGVQ